MTKISQLQAKIMRLFNKVFRENPNYFLRNISGVVHVGANTGQERNLYKKYGLSVVWIEPIDKVFCELNENIKEYNNQRAYKGLITDSDNKLFHFNIANNNGQSSSIFELGEHKEIWPDVSIERTVNLTSLTLPSLLKKEDIQLDNNQALIIDTQGSELLVLKGSIAILEHFKYIKTEVADFEAYEGCCQLQDIRTFMKENGYKECLQTKMAQGSSGGSYFDVVYERL